MSDQSLADEVREACAEVGIPDSVTLLIRHHRANAATAAGADLMAQGWTPPPKDQEPESDGIEFWTTLIRVTKVIDNDGQQALSENCTHVVGPFWIMEGDTDYLHEEGVRFEEVAEGAVPGLGDRTYPELLTICKQSYGIDLVA